MTCLFFISIFSHLKQKNRPILSDKTAYITNPKTNTMKNKKLYLYNSPKILYHEQITRFYNKPQSRYKMIDQIGQHRSRQISPDPTYEPEPSLLYRPFSEILLYYPELRCSQIPTLCNPVWNILSV